MKKIWLVVLIIVLAAGAIGYKIAFSYGYIKKVNSKIDMGGFYLLMDQDSKEMENKGFSMTGGFGCRPYESSKEGLRITFSGFPDVLDEYVITDIETTNPSYHFYGIHVGDDIKKAEDILKSSSFFIKDMEESNYREFKYKKMVVSFTLDDGGKVTKIRIWLSSTNRKDVLF